MTEIHDLNSKIQELIKCNVFSEELMDKIEGEINVFDKKKSLILDLIKLNIKEVDIKLLNYILEILFSTYNFDGKIEQKISVELTETLTVLTRLYNEFGIPNIETSYYLIFDIFFHNPGLIEQLNPKMRNALINEIKKISKLKYPIDKSKDSDLLMALQKIIDITFYFGEQQGKEIIEINFLNHFDTFIVACAKDELSINLPNMF
jgi:hypothetical protein